MVGRRKRWSATVKVSKVSHRCATLDVVKNHAPPGNRGAFLVPSGAPDDAEAETANQQPSLVRRRALPIKIERTLSSRVVIRVGSSSSYTWFAGVLASFRGRWVMLRHLPVPRHLLRFAEGGCGDRAEAVAFGDDFPTFGDELIELLPAAGPVFASG